jgi:hypothetical protein
VNRPLPYFVVAVLTFIAVTMLSVMGVLSYWVSGELLFNIEKLSGRVAFSAGSVEVAYTTLNWDRYTGASWEWIRNEMEPDILGRHWRLENRWFAWGDPDGYFAVVRVHLVLVVGLLSAAGAWSWIHARRLRRRQLGGFVPIVAGPQEGSK